RDGRVGRHRRGALLRRRAVRARADPDLVRPCRPAPAGGRRRTRMTPLLDVHCLSKTYHDGTLPVVNGLSFQVAEGELFALLGPSGCGKTTALRLLAGFMRPDHGRITLAGQVLADEQRFVPPEKRGIGFVFQDYALFPHLTVADNVAFG